MNLTNGRVTQNGNNISYKTKSYAKRMLDFNEFIDDFKLALESLNIATDDDFIIDYGDDDRRNRCLTIVVGYKGGDINVLPFEIHPIN